MQMRNTICVEGLWPNEGTTAFTLPVGDLYISKMPFTVTPGVHRVMATNTNIWQMREGGKKESATV